VRRIPWTKAIASIGVLAAVALIGALAWPKPSPLPAEPDWQAIGEIQNKIDQLANEQQQYLAEIEAWMKDRSLPMPRYIPPPPSR